LNQSLFLVVGFVESSVPENIAGGTFDHDFVLLLANYLTDV